MTELSEVLARYAGWGAPRPVSAGDDTPLGNTLNPPAPAEEVHRAWPGGVPNEVAALWAHTSGGKLFEDVKYGQWGLKLLSPPESAARTARERADRPEEIRADDIVLGEFLGDQELLVFGPSEPGDRRVLVELPLDKRPDWWAAASTLTEFLERYFAASGDKYWE
jgi:hypothetical protein